MAALTFSPNDLKARGASALAGMHYAALRFVLAAAAALVLVSAGPAQAADYEIMGKVTATIDGEEMTLWVPYDVDHGEDYAKVYGTGVFASTRIDAFSGEPGKSMDRPQIGISFVGSGKRARIEQVSVQMPGDGNRVWTAGGEEAFSGTVEDGTISRDDNTLTFSVTATAKPIQPKATPGDGDPIEAAEGDPKKVSFEGTVELRE